MLENCIRYEIFDISYLKRSNDFAAELTWRCLARLASNSGPKVLAYPDTSAQRTCQKSKQPTDLARRVAHAQYCRLRCIFRIDST